MDAEQHVDLDPPQERSGDEQRAVAALTDLADAPGLEGAGGPGVLAAVRRRAVRRRRRDRRQVVVGAAIAVVAVTAGALVVPAVLPDGGIIASLGLAGRGTVDPSPSTPAGPSTPPGPEAPAASVGAASLPMLSDPEVAELAAGLGDAGAGALVADGALALRREPKSSRIGDLGGWCGDTPLTIEYPAGDAWSAAWRGPGDASSSAGVSVAERVLSWGGGGPVVPFAVEGASAYVRATATSDVRCGASAGSEGSRTFSVLPEPSPGVVQAVAALDGAQPAWEVRTVAPTASGDVVDLTVVLAAPTGPEAGRAVLPLLQRALDRVTAWEAAWQPGVQAVSDPSVNAPGSVVHPTHDGQLTLEQVAAVLPGAVDGPPDTGEHGWDGTEITVGCHGPFFIPDGATNFDSSGPWLVFEAPHAGGTTSVTERLLRYEDGTAQDYVSATNDPTTVCEPAAAGQTWQAATLRHAGKTVEAVVRHPDGDPRQWVVRAAVAPDPATAVDLEVRTRASSTEELAAIVQPLLQRAEQSAYEANFVPSAP